MEVLQHPQDCSQWDLAMLNSRVEISKVDLAVAAFPSWDLAMLKSSRVEISKVDLAV